MIGMAEPKRQIPKGPEPGLAARGPESLREREIDNACKKLYGDATTALIKQHAWVLERELDPFIAKKLEPIKNDLKKILPGIRPGFVEGAVELGVIPFSTTFEEVKGLFHRLKLIMANSKEIPATDPDREFIFGLVGKIDTLGKNEKQAALSMAIVYQAERVLETELRYTNALVQKVSSLGNKSAVITNSDLLLSGMELKQAGLPKISEESITAIQLSSTMADMLAEGYDGLNRAFHSRFMAKKPIEYGEELSIELIPLLDLFNALERAKTPEEAGMRTNFLASEKTVERIFPAFKEAVLTYVAPSLLDLAKAQTTEDVVEQISSLRKVIEALAKVDRFETIPFVNEKKMMDIGLLG